MENNLENKINAPAEAPSILVADDDESVRTFIKSALNKYFSSYVVQEVKSGKELLENATQTKYHLIITDNDMEKKNIGVETIRALRANNMLAPVIIMSGRDSNEIRKYLDSPAGQTNISFLPKPTPLSLILSEANKYLNRQQEYGEQNGTNK